MNTENDYYELSGNTKEYEVGNIKKTLHQIVSLIDFEVKTINTTHKIKAGSLGGWIEEKSNLIDNSWIDEETNVFGNSVVQRSSFIRKSDLYDTQVHNSELIGVDSCHDYYNHSTIFSSSTDNSNFKKSLISSMYVTGSELSNATMYNGLCENSKVSGYYTLSTIVGSELSGISNYIEDSEISGVRYKETVKTYRANVNNCYDTMLFKRVGFFGKDLIFYQNKDNNLSVYHYGDSYDSVYEFEKQTVVFYLNDVHSKNKRSYVDIVQRTFYKIPIKRLGWFERLKINVSGYLKYLTFI